MIDRFYIIKSARPPLSILICSSYIACVANNTYFTRIYCKSSKPWQYSSPSGSAPSSSSSSSRYSTCTGSDGFCATAVLSRSPTIAPPFHPTGRNPFSRTPQSAAHKHTLKGTKQLHWNSKKTRFLPGDTRIFSFSDLSLSRIYPFSWETRFRKPLVAHFTGYLECLYPWDNSISAQSETQCGKQ